MKYHLVPTSRKISKEIVPNVRIEANALNREMIGLLRKLVKREENTFNELFYLYDASSMQQLKQLLSNSSAELMDEIIIHAEGYPFMIGPSISGGDFSISAFDLASYLKKNVLSVHPIHINLLACNSATNFRGSNFSRDLSRALTYCFNFPDINVIGYTGFVSVRNNAKFAVSSVLGRSIKGSHANLDDAKMIYNSGEVIDCGRQLIGDLSDYGFDWAREYIEKMHTQRTFVDKAILRQTRAELSIFKTSPDSKIPSDDNIDGSSAKSVGGCGAP